MGVKTTATVIHMRDRKEFDMRGNPNLFGKGVAIVGSSRPTQRGINIARSFGEQLAKASRLHVSGLAKGIDTAGHFGALSTGGTSLMVLPHGIAYQADRRPSCLRQYYQREGVTAAYLEISEFSANVPFAGWRAIRRNQTIVDFSYAVVVVETAPFQKAVNRRSGTFQTARLALAARVPVFCVMPDVLFPEMPVPRGNGNADLIAEGVTGIPAEGVEALIPFLCSASLHLYSVLSPPEVLKGTGGDVNHPKLTGYSDAAKYPF